MPKLRAVRTKEEAELVPTTEAVAVVLEEAAPPVETVEVEDKKPPLEATPEADDPTVSLKAQLEESKKAQADAQAQLQASQERERALSRERDTSRRESTHFQENAEEAKYLAVVNALGAAKAEADAASQAWAAADNSGDMAAKVEAQRRMARAEANIARYEDSKSDFDAEREARKTAPKREPERQQQDDPVETTLAGMPEGARTWLRSHPEYLTDTRKNAKLQALHWDVVDEGHPQFSTAYFESLETHLGLRKGPDPEPEPAPQPRSRAVPSAPPSRDVPSPSTGKPVSTRVELSPDEREVAKLSGITDIEYARNKILFDQRKKQGYYQER